LSCLKAAHWAISFTPAQQQQQLRAAAIFLSCVGVAGLQIQTKKTMMRDLAVKIADLQEQLKTQVRAHGEGASGWWQGAGETPEPLRDAAAQTAGAPRMRSQRLPCCAAMAPG
jgi:hypothetical protein